MAEDSGMRTLEVMALAVAVAAVALVLVVAAENRDRDAATTAKSEIASPAAAPAAGSEPSPSRDRREPATSAPSAPAAPEAEAHPVVQVKPGQQVVLRDEPDGEPVSTVRDETKFGSPSTFSVVRSEDRWVGVPSPDLPNGELGWIRIDPDRLLGGAVDLEIRVDLSQRRTELIRDGEVVREFAVTVGAPSTPTPTGRFAVTDSFRGDLHPAYGCCALALTATQPNLPPGWPGGDRIAIHGTSAPLGEAASNGCVRAADKEVSHLVDIIPPGTPVVIRK
jgi:lipoprotein-anchoring transpeptidase ErfK/SrfK